MPVDCVRANELCAAEPSCSSRYRTLRQCLAGRDRNTMLANKECQAALEVLQESPLYDCRCKRGMKKELQCLQIYWSIHLGLTEGTGLGAAGRRRRWWWWGWGEGVLDLFGGLGGAAFSTRKWLGVAQGLVSLLLEDAGVGWDGGGAPAVGLGQGGNGFGGCSRVGGGGEGAGRGRRAPLQPLPPSWP